MNDKNIKIISIIVLLIVNVFLYAKTAGYDFVNYDDPKYVIENQYIKNINSANTKRIFSKVYFVPT